MTVSPRENTALPVPVRTVDGVALNSKVDSDFNGRGPWLIAPPKPNKTRKYVVPYGWVEYNE